MINIGIVVYNSNQLEKITNLLIKYLHCNPSHKSRNYSEWILPLITIEVVIAYNTLGYRFDILYYDERIEQQYIKDVLSPCCFYCKPRPINHLLLLLNN